MFNNKLIQLIFDPSQSKKWQIIFWLNAALLLYLTLAPAQQQAFSYPNIDKLFHFIGFGSFAFFFALAFPKLRYWQAILISICLGISVEIVQSFIPYRSFSFADMLADLAGIITAVVFIALVKPQPSISEKNTG